MKSYQLNILLIVLLILSSILNIFLLVKYNRTNKVIREIQESYLEQGELDNNYILGDVFYAEIEDIWENNGKTIVLVKGLRVNDINHRGKFTFSIDEDTLVLWRYVKIKSSNLKVGQNISITSTGMVLESSPAQLTKVSSVILLNDEF